MNLDQLKVVIEQALPNAKVTKQSSYQDNIAIEIAGSVFIIVEADEDSLEPKE